MTVSDETDETSLDTRIPFEMELCPVHCAFLLLEPAGLYLTLAVLARDTMSGWQGTAQKQ